MELTIDKVRAELIEKATAHYGEGVDIDEMLRSVMGIVVVTPGIRYCTFVGTDVCDSTTDYYHEGYVKVALLGTDGVYIRDSNAATHILFITEGPMYHVIRMFSFSKMATIAGPTRVPFSLKDK